MISKELKLVPCNVCKKIPELEHTMIDIDGMGTYRGEYWVIDHEHLNDDNDGSTIYITYPTKESVIKEWNAINESNKLPDWLKTKIEFIESTFESGFKEHFKKDEYTAGFQDGYLMAVKKILELRKEDVKND